MNDLKYFLNFSSVKLLHQNVENTKQRYELTPQEEEEEPWLKIRNMEISTFDTHVDGPPTNFCGLQFGKTTNTWRNIANLSSTESAQALLYEDTFTHIE